MGKIQEWEKYKHSKKIYRKIKILASVNNAYMKTEERHRCIWEVFFYNIQYKKSLKNCKLQIKRLLLFYCVFNQFLSILLQ